MLCVDPVASCSHTCVRTLPQCRHIPNSALRVTTDELCAAIRAGFNDTRTIFEPAGACPAPTTSGVGLSGRGLSGTGATWDGAQWEWAWVCQRRTLTNSRGGSGGDSRMHSLCGHDMDSGFEWGRCSRTGGGRQVCTAGTSTTPADPHPATHTLARSHTRARARAHTHTHRHTHTRARKHTHTHTQTHKQAHRRRTRCFCR